jgi:hypothetical protein
MRAKRPETAAIELRLAGLVSANAHPPICEHSSKQKLVIVICYIGTSASNGVVTPLMKEGDPPELHTTILLVISAAQLTEQRRPHREPRDYCTLSGSSKRFPENAGTSASTRAILNRVA